VWAHLSAGAMREDCLLLQQAASSLDFILVKTALGYTSCHLRELPTLQIRVRVLRRHTFTRLVIGLSLLTVTPSPDCQKLDLSHQSRTTI